MKKKKERMKQQRKEGARLTGIQNKQQRVTMYGFTAAIHHVLPLGFMFQKCCIQTKQG